MSGHRCEICIDPMCDGKKNCDCTSCSRKDECHRELKPTIRINTKCTQSCRHCCFSCSPQHSAEMSLESAQRVAAFMRTNHISHAEIMGGEFYLHSAWREVVEILTRELKFVRVVTNADWAGDPVSTKEVVDFFKERDNIYLSISKDRWHTNTHVEAAAEILTRANIAFNMATEERTSEDSIVPVGRSSFESGSFYGMLSCWCHNPLRKYSFLVADDKIYKCGFGIWHYADVADYTDGGFAERFKEFNTKFYQAFLTSCRHCQMACPDDRKVNNKL